MFDLLTTILTGGATGLLGTAFTGITAFFKNKQEAANTAAEREHEKNMRLMDIDADKAEAAAAGKREALQVEAEATASAIASASALAAASMNADKATYSKGKHRPKWAEGALASVDVVRGYMRPFITSTLLIDIMMIANRVGAGGVINEADRTIIYLGTTAVTWWFGARPIEKMIAKGAK